MRAGLCAVLAVSSAQVGIGSHSVSSGSGVPKVPSREGAALGPGKVSAEHQQQQQRALQAPARKGPTAWALPWLPRRRRQERQGSVKKANGKAAAPAVDSTMRSPASAFNGALASIVGAMLIGGGTLSLAPQVVDASPFDPRPPPKPARQPFFEGWFIRWVGDVVQPWACLALPAGADACFSDIFWSMCKRPSGIRDATSQWSVKLRSRTGQPVVAQSKYLGTASGSE